MKKSKKTTTPKSTSSSFQWNEVTPLSKYMAMGLFIAFPFVAFAMGMAYQEEISVAACSWAW